MWKSLYLILTKTIHISGVGPLWTWYPRFRSKDYSSPGLTGTQCHSAWCNSCSSINALITRFACELCSNEFTVVPDFTTHTNLNVRGPAGKCCLNCPSISTAVLLCRVLCSHPTRGVIALITRPVTGYGYHPIPARRKLFQSGQNWCNTFNTRQVISWVCEVRPSTWSVSIVWGSLWRMPYHQVVAIHGYVTLRFYTDVHNLWI